MARPQKENGYTSIANELLEAIMRCPLPLYEWRVLLCVIRFTYGWNKKDAYISYSTISRATVIKPPHVVRAVKGLAAKNIIRTSKEDKGVKYSIQKDYDKWVFPLQGIPLQAKTITSTGNTSFPLQVIGTPLKSMTDECQREPKDSIKDIYKDISLRERLLKEMKKIFPALSVPDFIPDEKLDFLIYKTGKGEIRADSIKSPLAYLKGMTVSEAFPSFLEREAKAEKKRQEERERREREKEGERQREANLEFNHQKVKELISNLGGKGWKTHTRSGTNIVVR